MPRAPSPKSENIEALLIVLLAFAAYGTVLVGYIPAADDLVLVESLWNPTNVFNYHHQGAWRLLSIALMSSGLIAGPSLYLSLVMVLHASNGLLVRSLLLRLGSSPQWSLAAAALFVAFPGYHEALAWIAASNVVWSAHFFLLTFYFLLRGPPASLGDTLLTAGAVVALTVIGNLMNEQLLFAYIALPAAILLLKSESRHTRVRSVSITLAPWIGCALYLAAYFLTIHPTTTKHPSFSLRAALSPLYHQFSNLMVFEVWGHPLWVTRFLATVATPLGSLALIALTAGALLFLRPARTSPSFRSTEGRSPWHVFAGWTSLLLGASCIYALAGGYSLDSRKRYIFVLIIFAGAGHLCSALFTNLPRYWRHFIIASCIISALTSQALTQTRKEMLWAVKQLETELLHGIWQTPLYIKAWDSSPSSIQKHLWIDMREELWYFRLPGDKSQLVLKEKIPACVALHYNWKCLRWSETD